MKQSANQPVNAFILVRYFRILGDYKICEEVWRFRRTTQGVALGHVIHNHI
jgi:hypothetical protein